MTLEEALERIVELESTIKEQSNNYNALESIKSELESKIKEQDANICSLKKSNMKFFTLLTAQEKEEQDEVEEVKEPVAQNWDDFLNDI